jgi:hypothetical protein
MIGNACFPITENTSNTIATGIARSPLNLEIRESGLSRKKLDDLRGDE